MRSFYFTVLSQFFFYTDLSSDLGPLYQSEEIILDATDIQGMVHVTSTSD
jgi:hypothetical protein